MRSQESNYMYPSFTKSTIKNQNTQLPEKSVGITIRMFPDYPTEKSQYPINKKNQWVLPNSPKFLIWSSGSLNHFGPRVQEELAFKANYSRFSIFSTGGHFVHRSKTVFSYFGRGSV